MNAPKKKKTSAKLKITRLHISPSVLFNGSLWDSILKYLPTIGLFIMVIIIYISLRFYTQVKLAEIERLTLRLEQRRSIVISQTSEMVNKTNQNDVIQMIKERNLNLQPSTTPPYRIK